VLEGSVQQSGERIRVTAQLIDAPTGRHVWSERYDRVLEDIFAVQDEIMMNTIRAMEVSVSGLEILQELPTPKSVEAYFKILKAQELVFNRDKGDNLLSRKLIQEAIALDPDYGPAYIFLGLTYTNEVVCGWSDNAVGSLGQAEELGKKALTLGGIVGHGLLMRVYSLQGQIDKAIAEGEKGLTISPNFANLNVNYGNTLSIAGRHEEAIERVKKGMRLNPHHQPWYLNILGDCYFRAGMIEEAIESYERDAQRAPNTLNSWLSLAGLYSQLGREEEAKKAAKAVLRIAPDYSWDKYRRPYIFNDKEVEKRFFDGLRKIGLK
jgi:adenylate cyclase